MMAILALDSRLIGSDRKRRLGRFETATCLDRIPSVVLPASRTQAPSSRRSGREKHFDL